MDEWLDRLADELGEPRVTPAELGAILKLTRRVAHGVERKLAPLSAFVLGVSVGRRTASGSAREDAFAETLAVAEPLVPEPQEDQD